MKHLWRYRPSTSTSPCKNDNDPGEAQNFPIKRTLRIIVQGRINGSKGAGGAKFLAHALAARYFLTLSLSSIKASDQKPKIPYFHKNLISPKRSVKKYVTPNSFNK